MPDDTGRMYDVRTGGRPYEVALLWRAVGQIGQLPSRQHHIVLIYRARQTTSCEVQCLMQNVPIPSFNQKQELSCAGWLKLALCCLPTCMGVTWWPITLTMRPEQGRPRSILHAQMITLLCKFSVSGGCDYFFFISCYFILLLPSDASLNISKESGHFEIIDILIVFVTEILL